MIDYGSETRRINAIVNAGARTRMNDIRFLEKEIEKWKVSPVRRDMILAQRYYQGDHDILHTPRTVINGKGELEPVKNLPDNRIVDNQYQKAVDQKKNYLLSKPFTVTTKNDRYTEALKYILDKKFMRSLKRIAGDSINGGIGYLYPYYNDLGQLQFKRFNNYEVILFWADEEHTELDCFGRLYHLDGYEGETEKTYEFFELYSRSGVDRYQLDGSHLIPDVLHPSGAHYLVEQHDPDGQHKEVPYNWDRVPLVVFKRNAHEIPLIKCCKSLQDGINRMVSTFENNMCEDARNTILVLVNYDGTNLGDFRKNLSQYGAVKVRNDGTGAGGDVRALTVEVNAENYRAILDVFKQALIENCKTYDAKDARLTGDANQMHIQTIYQDIELDAQDMETEYQAAFEDLLWFVDQHLANTGQGDFEQEEVDITFNRNILVNETELIDNCTKSVGLLPTKLILQKHPWVEDVEETMKLLEEEKQKQMEQMDPYGQAFAKLKQGQEKRGDGINDDGGEKRAAE